MLFIVFTSRKACVEKVHLPLLANTTTNEEQIVIELGPEHNTSETRGERAFIPYQTSSPDAAQGSVFSSRCDEDSTTKKRKILNAAPRSSSVPPSGWRVTRRVFSARRRHLPDTFVYSKALCVAAVLQSSLRLPQRRLRHRLCSSLGPHPAGPCSLADGAGGDAGSCGAPALPLSPLPSSSATTSASSASAFSTAIFAFASSPACVLLLSPVCIVLPARLALPL